MTIKTYKEVSLELTALQIKYDLLCEQLKTQATQEYYGRLEKMAKDMDEPWDDKRIDIIGQNGNDGLHYKKEE